MDEENNDLRLLSLESSWEEVISRLSEWGSQREQLESNANAILQIKCATETAKHQEKIVRATWVLAFCTAVLCLVTFLNIAISYYSYKGTEAQIEVIGKLEKSFQRIPPAIDQLTNASERQVQAVSELNKGIRYMAMVMPKSEKIKELEEKRRRPRTPR